MAYRCDTRPNSAGGDNVVVTSCAGRVGSCPRTAAQAVGGGAPARTGTRAVTAAVPNFTG